MVLAASESGLEVPVEVEPFRYALSVPSNRYNKKIWQNFYCVSPMVNLILHARSGYIRRFILIWLTQKLDLENCDQFAKVIHDLT